LHRSEKAPLLRKAQKWATPEKQCYIGLGVRQRTWPQKLAIDRTSVLARLRFKIPMSLSGREVP
jgi:hypothetical protein